MPPARLLFRALGDGRYPMNRVHGDLVHGRRPVVAGQMSVDSPSLLGALQSGAGAVPRRPGARRLLEDCWTPIRNAVELRFADILLETLGPLAKSEDEDEARPAKHVLLRDKATLQAFSESLQAEFKQ